LFPDKYAHNALLGSFNNEKKNTRIKMKENSCIIRESSIKRVHVNTTYIAHTLGVVCSPYIKLRKRISENY